MQSVEAEMLEARTILSVGIAADSTFGASPLDADTTPPVIVSVRLVGGPVRTSGIRVTFSEPMAPGVGNRDNYRVSVNIGHYENINDDNDDFADDQDEWTSDRGVRLSEALWRESDNSVLLRPSHRFNPYKDFKTLQVRSGGVGLRDLAGNRLDGNQDGIAGGRAVMRFKVKYGKTFSFIDHDGDRVTLKVRNSGNAGVLQQMVSPRKGKPGDAIQVWLLGEVKEWTVVTGTVTPTKLGGDGHVVIRELLGVANAKVKLLEDPAFTVLNFQSPDA